MGRGIEDSNRVAQNSPERTVQQGRSEACGSGGAPGAWRVDPLEAAGGQAGGGRNPPVASGPFGLRGRRLRAAWLAPPERPQLRPASQAQQRRVLCSSGRLPDKARRWTRLFL